MQREFQDVVNKMQWKQCYFSCDSDYIIGGIYFVFFYFEELENPHDLQYDQKKGSAQKAEHNIYIWNRTYGQLLKILEGPKEGIMDLMVKI